MHVLVELPVGNWRLRLMAGGSVQGSLFCIAGIALAIPWTLFLYSEFNFDVWYQPCKKTLIVRG